MKIAWNLLLEAFHTESEQNMWKDLLDTWKCLIMAFHKLGYIMYQYGWKMKLLLTSSGYLLYQVKSNLSDGLGPDTKPQRDRHNVLVSYSECFQDRAISLDSTLYTVQTSNTACPHTSYEVHWCWRWNFENVLYYINCTKSGTWTINTGIRNST
jgi:hypothetical protein